MYTKALFFVSTTATAELAVLSHHKRIFLPEKLTVFGYAAKTICAEDALQPSCI